MLRALSASLSSSGASNLENVCILIAIGSAFVLLIGLMGEFPNSEKWKKCWLYQLAKISVIVAVFGELLGDAGIFVTSDRIQELTDDSIRENIRVENAMLAQLKARDFTKQQFATFVSELDGKLKTVTVFTIPDPESFEFGLNTMEALRKAHIDVKWVASKEIGDSSGNPPIPGMLIFIGNDATPDLKEQANDLMKAAIDAGQSVGLGAKQGTVGIELYIGLHPIPFLSFPEYDLPPGQTLPAPNWQPR